VLQVFYVLSKVFLEAVGTVARDHLHPLHLQQQPLSLVQHIPLKHLADADGLDKTCHVELAVVPFDSVIKQLDFLGICIFPPAHPLLDARQQTDHVKLDKRHNAEQVRVGFTMRQHM